MFGNKVDFRIKYGPWAIVAGASEGLGAAFARALARRGINLILIARREEMLKSLASDLLESHGVSVEYYPVDLSDLTETGKLIKGLEQEIGLLVYNAAFAPIGSFASIAEENLLKVPDVNIKAPLLLARLLSPAMIERKKGGIIFMSSLSGFHGSPGITTYSASKAFNTILAEGLWAELRNEGVHVMASCAGAIRTPGYNAASGKKEAPGTMEPSLVAEQTLDALGKGPVFIPGKLNLIFSLVMNKLISRKRAIRIMEQNTKDLT